METSAGVGAFECNTLARREFVDATEDWRIVRNTAEDWIVTGIRGIFTVREQLIGKTKSRFQ